MVEIFTALLQQALPYLALAGAAIAGGAFALWRAWRKGKADQAAAQAAEEAKARDIADQVDNDVGALPADKVRQELKTWDK
ncbi:hypothetical protein LB572_02950 [Mesorhizobium sp. BH1-1-5]|uniref:hypothetical protein n=1 Tax=Mesorhizobium sp. BH1-1-5 TaxID=2876661 RepID=UPI001CCCB5E9|nr:hypothetical protein [Mesorhizobium sp. BH1-1-5]MBZ9986050.1 hypothetical protein [Mesorhizobium sp. BH1-1-5]